MKTTVGNGSTILPPSVNSVTHLSVSLNSARSHGRAVGDGPLSLQGQDFARESSDSDVRIRDHK